MSIYLLKSIMSIVIILLTMISIYTMLEIFGRSPVTVDVRKYKKIHKVTGYAYIVIFIIVSYFCLNYIFLSRTELTPRSTLHGFLSITVLVLFAMKVLITRVYKHFYNQVLIYGLSIALITFGIVGSSAGYYLIVSRLGTDVSFDKIIQYKKWAASQKKETGIDNTASVDPGSIKRGKVLFESKCAFCHDSDSSENLVGPGLIGISKNPELPVSRRPATQANIMKQLKTPFSRMPSFDYLSDKELDDIMAFLNTL